MRTFRKLVAGSTALLASCVTITDPVSVGDNSYLITLNARGGFHSDGELLTQSIEKASAFCQAKGLRVQVADTKVSGVQMWTPQNNEVYFSCR